MSTSYNFHDKALADAVKAGEARFKSFQRLLNETSSDIKSLELWLRDCGICLSVFVSVAENDSIGWDKYNDQWRLVYKHFDLPDMYSDEPELDVRPLLETNAKFRVACKPHLVDLITEISKLLPDADESEVSPQASKPRAKTLFRIRKEHDQGSRVVPSGSPNDDIDMIFANNDEIPF